MLQGKINKAGVESGSHGMGTVLIKEFTEKLGASLQILYSNGRIHVQVLIPVPAVQSK